MKRHARTWRPIRYAGLILAVLCAMCFGGPSIASAQSTGGIRGALRAMRTRTRRIVRNARARIQRTPAVGRVLNRGLSHGRQSSAFNRSARQFERALSSALNPQSAAGRTPGEPGRAFQRAERAYRNMAKQAKELPDGADRVIAEARTERALSTLRRQAFAQALQEGRFQDAEHWIGRMKEDTRSDNRGFGAIVRDNEGTSAETEHSPLFRRALSAVKGLARRYRVTFSERRMRKMLAHQLSRSIRSGEAVHALDSVRAGRTIRLGEGPDAPGRKTLAKRVRDAKRKLEQTRRDAADAHASTTIARDALIAEADAQVQSAQQELDAAEAALEQLDKKATEAAEPGQRYTDALRILQRLSSQPAVGEVSTGRRLLASLNARLSGRGRALRSVERTLLTTADRYARTRSADGRDAHLASSYLTSLREIEVDGRTAAERHPRKHARLERVVRNNVRKQLEKALKEGEHDQVQLMWDLKLGFHEDALHARAALGEERLTDLQREYVQLSRSDLQRERAMDIARAKTTHIELLVRQGEWIRDNFGPVWRSTQGQYNATTARQAVEIAKQLAGDPSFGAHVPETLMTRANAVTEWAVGRIAARKAEPNLRDTLGESFARNPVKWAIGNTTAALTRRHSGEPKPPIPLQRFGELLQKAGYESQVQTNTPLGPDPYGRTPAPAM